MVRRVSHALSCVFVVVMLLGRTIDSGAAGDVVYAPRTFAAGLYGEFTLNMNQSYSLFRDQNGLLLSYAYRALNDCALGVAGPKGVRDAVLELNARLIAAFIGNDQKGYTEIFRPDDYPFPRKLTADQAKAGFDMFRAPFTDCADAIIVGDVVYDNMRLLLVQPVRAGARRDPSVVLGYEEYGSGKWRFSRIVTGTRYAPVFLNALTGPPLDDSKLSAEWKKEYVICSLPAKSQETCPAKEILLRVQRVNNAVHGKTIESVLKEFLKITEGFPADKAVTPTDAVWARLSTTVTAETLKGLREGYEQSLSQGAPPTYWKDMIIPNLGAWDGGRFVVDCDRAAFLLCIDDIHPSVGCVSFLKQPDGSYRICNMNVQADFMGLFYDDDFCTKLKERLKAFP